MFFDKLVLGTVQFGMDYGIANRSGQVSKEELDAVRRQNLELLPIC